MRAGGRGVTLSAAGITPDRRRIFGIAIQDKRRLPNRAGDACADRRTRALVKRSAAVLVLLAAPLAGCKEPPGAPQVAAGFVRPGTDVVIENVREISASDALAQSSDEYYVVRFAWTNHVGYALAPRIDRFVLEDTNRRRFLGSDSGSAALIGIENYAGLLEQGASHDYTVGFRVPQNTAGTLYYDAPF
jgi:hypothetical protein